MNSLHSGNKKKKGCEIISGDFLKVYRPLM